MSGCKKNFATYIPLAPEVAPQPFSWNESTATGGDLGVPQTALQDSQRRSHHCNQSRILQNCDSITGSLGEGVDFYNDLHTDDCNLTCVDDSKCVPVAYIGDELQRSDHESDPRAEDDADAEMQRRRPPHRGNLDKIFVNRFGVQACKNVVQNGCSKKYLSGTLIEDNQIATPSRTVFKR